MQNLKYDPLQKKLYHQTRNPPPIKEVKGLVDRLVSPDQSLSYEKFKEQTQ